MSELITIPTKPDWNEVIKSIEPVKSFEATPITNFNAIESFYKSILDQRKIYLPPPAVVKLVHGDDTYTLLSKKSFSLWQGKQKSKKTTALSLAVASLIGVVNHSDKIRFEAALEGVVIFFDNEQGESYAARTMNLILKLANVEVSELLIYCDLRDFTPKQRMEIIKAAVASTPNVIMIVVDGIVDLMDDFMDAKEGMLTVTDLTRLSSQYDIHVAGVLHQNKGASTDARAHVGSISAQKCEREIMIENDANDSTQSFIISKSSRDVPFEKFAIRWEKGSLPGIVQDIGYDFEQKTTGKTKSKGTSPSDFDALFHRDLLSNIFSTTPEPRHDEFWRCIKLQAAEKGVHFGDNKAKDFKQYYVNNNYIRAHGKPKSPDNYYVLV